MARDPHPSDGPGLSDSGPSPPFPQTFSWGKDVIWGGMLCSFQECRIRERDRAYGRVAWGNALRRDHMADGDP